jgi:hypothetical protein
MGHVGDPVCEDFVGRFCVVGTDCAVVDMGHVCYRVWPEAYGGFWVVKHGCDFILHCWEKPFDAGILGVCVGRRETKNNIIFWPGLADVLVFKYRLGVCVNYLDGGDAAREQVYVSLEAENYRCPVFFPCGTIRKNISRICVNERMDIVFFVDARDWEGPPHVSECEGDVGWVVWCVFACLRNWFVFTIAGEARCARVKPFGTMRGVEPFNRILRARHSLISGVVPADVIKAPGVR